MAGLTRIFNGCEDNETPRRWFHRWRWWRAVQSNSPSANKNLIAQFGDEAKAGPLLCGLVGMPTDIPDRRVIFRLATSTPRPAAIFTTGRISGRHAQCRRDKVHETGQEKS